MHVIIQLSKPIECTAPRMMSNVNCGLWVILMCQCNFMDCHKGTTLPWDVESGGGCTHGSWGTWVLSVLYVHFAMNLKLL